ncbi:MAG: hypothetical protein A2Z25_20380 [Planctomycetes bacterium RBG_16_55_9]|nr:MAG: hypothetical protein A2Z25_20380 [Planctomycetes bacterium RBG_16_55_9]
MRNKNAKTEQGGFVVVVVLCMVMMLSVLLLGFHHEARVNLHSVDDFRRSEQARHCAKAGLNIAIAALKESPDIRADKLQRNLPSYGNTFAVGEGQCSVTLSQESGKLNVNFLKDRSGKLNQTAIDQVLRLFDLLNQQKNAQPQMSYALVPAIIDWADGDDEISDLPFILCESRGAESDYYRRSKPPYACRNGPLETTEELVLVKGMTKEVFDRVSDYLTVYGDGKINVNHASALVLQSLSEQMDAALARRIENRRQLQSFESVAELRDLPGMTETIYNTIRRSATVEPSSEYFHVVSQGSVDRLSRTIVAILHRSGETKNVEVILYKEL